MNVVTLHDEKPNPRDVLGLTQANDGDLRALYRFLSWVENELQMLGSVPATVPAAVQFRLQILARETERTRIFVDGFETAKRRRKR